jgi:hypothetical protein
MGYSISIMELLDRPIIGNRYALEFMNKMTEEENIQYEKELNVIMRESKTPEKYPDWNSEYLAKTIDRQILYDVLKLK